MAPIDFLRVQRQIAILKFFRLLRSQFFRQVLVFITGMTFSIQSFAEVKEAQKKLVVLGDSLTEGYGVPYQAAFPALLEKKIKASGKNWVVVNAGISGSTSASGEARLRWQLKQKPDLLILALGANDGLRGLQVQETEKNLDKILSLAQTKKLPVVLCGMMMPPNYGSSFTESFSAIYPKLAQKYKIPLVPFLLEKVAGKKELNLEDGIHPNEKGHQIILETVYQKIKDLL